MRWNLATFFKNGSHLEELGRELQALFQEISELHSLLSFSQLDTNNLKNWEFDKEASHIFCSERVAIAERLRTLDNSPGDCYLGKQVNAVNWPEGGASENKKYETRPMPSRTDSSGYLCLPTFIDQVQKCDARLNTAESFIACLQAQDVDDDRADKWAAELSTLQAAYQALIHRFEDCLFKLTEHEFNALLENPSASEIAFILKERRARAAEKLAVSVESLISDLSIDGFEGWWQVYCSLVGRLKVFDLSVGQAENQLTDADRSVRQSTFHALQNKWQEYEPVFAQILNHLVGFRLKVYEKRGQNDFLKEPLEENRMSYQTLQVMWDVVEKGKAPFLNYLKIKAERMNLKALSWCDVDAPYLPSTTEKISYEDACQLIEEQFAAFSPRMAAFARKAFNENWIEAEDRPGKRPGGFCTFFPIGLQSRIFMTYSGSASSVETLAHELGHAYHNEMVQSLPSFAQHYRMNVAETASTFAEMLVIDSLVKKSRSHQEKLSLLAQKIERSIVFMMNIHSRFLFEKAFYEKRRATFLSPAELCDLMGQAQKMAYHDALEEWHPYFWASKMHFYFADLSFYNFPYTFGFLFSLGIYARALKEGPQFADKYDDLLRDSGQMTVEELAQKHLGVDLTQPDFWQEAIQIASKDVEAFMEAFSLG